MENPDSQLGVFLCYPQYLCSFVKMNVKKEFLNWTFSLRKYLLLSDSFNQNTVLVHVCNSVRSLTVGQTLELPAPYDKIASVTNYWC